MNTDQFKTEEETLTRATFIGPMNKSKEVMAALHEQGWRLTRTGPEVGPGMKTTGNFLFIGERDYIPPGCPRCDDRRQHEREAEDGMQNAAEIAGLQ